MKHIYQTPATMIVDIELTSMIALSNPQGFNDELDDEGTSGDKGLSRHRTVWDDEEEDGEADF